MNIPIEPATRVFAELVKGRGTAKEAALRTLDTSGPSFDREHLRTLIVRAIKSDYQPPRPGQSQDLWSSDTRCWLLSALGRVCEGDRDAAALVRRHLDPAVEPYKWARYWALEGLYVGNPGDLLALAQQIAVSNDDPLIVSLATAIVAATGDNKAIADVEHRLQGKDDEKWAMLRGLRVVPALDGAIVTRVCDMVKAGTYSDVTFDAIIALGRIAPDSRHAETAARTLAD